MNYKPGLNKPYTDQDMQGILDDTLRVLKEIGIECNESQTIERVTAEPGVSWDAGRLYFDIDTMNKYIDLLRKENLGKGPFEEPAFEATPAWCCLNYADPDTGEVRSPTTEDAIQMTRLMDGFGGHDWAIPLVPRDINPRHVSLLCEYIALSNSRSLGGSTAVMDITEIEFMIEMHQSVGRTYLLDEQVGISRATA